MSVRFKGRRKKRHDAASAEIVPDEMTEPPLGQRT
jgi:hypothetical protein